MSTDRATRALVVAALVAALTGCAARAIRPSADVAPEPGAAVAFFRIRVTGMRFASVSLYGATGEIGPLGSAAASVSATGGTRVYAFSLEPGRYSLRGVVPADDPRRRPDEAAVRYFDLAPDAASYLGTYTALTPSGSYLLAAEESAATFERARAELAHRYPRLAALPIRSAIDLGRPAAPPDEPERSRP